MQWLVHYASPVVQIAHRMVCTEHTGFYQLLLNFLAAKGP